MTSILIPLYVYPDMSNPTGAWNTLIARANANPSVQYVVIINPYNGPTAQPDPGYVAGIQALSKCSNVSVIGYVNTQYGTVPLATAEQQASLYKSEYALDKGIFWDNMSNVPGFEAYYDELADYCNENIGPISVGNAGAMLPMSYYQFKQSIVVVYEGQGPPPNMGIYTQWTQSLGVSRFGLICHSLTASQVTLSFLSQIHENFGAYYLTDALGPPANPNANTYGQLSAFL